MNWNVRVWGLMLLALCTWALPLPTVLAEPPELSSSFMAIDSPADATTLTDLSATVPLEHLEPKPETETANTIAEPGSIGLVALLALMGGGAMAMRRRLG